MAENGTDVAENIFFENPLLEEYFGGRKGKEDGRKGIKKGDYEKEIIITIIVCEKITENYL